VVCDLCGRLFEGNDELIRSFLFDAEATRGAHSSWMKENWDDSSSDSGSLNLK